jgi:hypothetical protein
VALNPKRHRLNRDDTLEFTPDPESGGDISDKEEQEVAKHLATPHQRVYKWAQLADDEMARVSKNTRKWKVLIVMRLIIQCAPLGV